ncbi:MFS transporter [Pseudomonas amygdali pv. eriobotryae]|nr:MFS transporter [Pseudomonas amygdali]KWS78385.1 MFS transporter [Pseudomonas amygdali pv. eriobotryae]GFZ62750.1 MFS transporter [Pseudomonas amygdali pv. eriobotryae]GFZ73886.1 MFS transporter [Pseudomonas amygdali pv. eriobotryae]
MARRELLQLVFAQIFILAAMMGLRLAAPLFALSLDYSAGAVGALVALFALVQVFLSIPAGRYADRQGIKRPMGFAVSASVCALAVLAVFPSVTALCIAAMVTGASSGVTSIVLQRYLGRVSVSNHERKNLFSWFAMSPAVSGFVGPYAAGLIIDHATGAADSMLSFQICFAVLGCLPILTWLLLLPVKELPVTPVSPSQAPTQTWGLLRSKNFRYILFVNWLLACVWDVHSFLVPVLGYERGCSASTTGMILGGFALAAAFIRMALPLLGSRLTEKQIIAASLGVTVLVFATYPFAQLPSQMFACSIVLGLALGSVQPMIMSMLIQVTPPAKHGIALGIRLTALNASTFVIPMIAGSFGALIGVSAVFWIVALMVAGGSPAVRMITIKADHS